MSSYSQSSSSSSSPRPPDQRQQQQPRTQQPQPQNQQRRSSSLQQSAASYFSYPVTHVVSGLYRRFTDPQSTKNQDNNSSSSSSTMRRPFQSTSSISSTTTTTNPATNTSTLFTPIRTASPFQPPPLTPLTLTDPENHSQHSAQTQDYLLTRSLAEEIRLLVPARLQLCDTWRLAYSLERDGASLSTLYENCRAISQRSPRAGYVLIIRDASPSTGSSSSYSATGGSSSFSNTNNGPGGAVFGAYMTDPPHPDSHYFGTGECFLWRASVVQPPSADRLLQLTAAAAAGHHTQDPGMQTGAGPGTENDVQQTLAALERAGLPLPPSADTTHAGRSTTLRSWSPLPRGPGPASTSNSGTATPEQIRFKAFPYSGVNDYMMFCETGFLSLGGGDGHYGLWVDSSLEKGVSAASQTFGNEPLSDEGIKFDILGVEVWYVGS
ncbi:putative oxidative stress response protein Oxr1 [Aspergillus homomorphus CBS 101889]|uniref:Oxidation resistance protein 1 n=1 Tax=Aspergillus homomorphus (strain CBS 101889) TaxID=1450537 RepID=A0A395HSK1_ASPHC|nr:TLD-domain-containing protein [Aspergillus homomorphus CBS 101889]RAL10807.1 TLD-domain-containing protein [Aspergillus homomorphus CBS 101889]